MFGIKYIPQCAGCGAINQKLLLRRGVGFCAKCVFAISQRNNLDGVRNENKIKSEELKAIQDRIEAGVIEGAVLLERNGEVQADLIKAYRRIKQLESVK